MRVDTGSSDSAYLWCAGQHPFFTIPEDALRATTARLEEAASERAALVAAQEAEEEATAMAGLDFVEQL
jgi:hypothetical protein